MLRPLVTIGSPPGAVVGWGNNISGEATGVPTSGNSAGMVTIAGQYLANAISIAAGMGHSLALRSDGSVVGWGNNGRGQATGSPSTYPGRAAGVVKVDGQFMSNVVTIAAAWTHSYAILSDGTAVSWGTTIDGGKIQIKEGQSKLVSLAGWYGLATTTDGTMVSIRSGETLGGLSNIVAASAPMMSNHGPLVTLQIDGTVFERTLGRSPSSTLVVANATAISAGRWQNLALKEDGTVFGWGPGSFVPGGLSNVVAISAGESHSLALKQDGTVITWGQEPRFSMGGLSVPSGLSNIVAIAAGNGFSLVITTNEAVAERFKQ